MLFAIKLAAYAVTLILILSFIGFYLVVRPRRLITTVTPEKFGIPYEEVSFRTEDSILIKGWFIQNKDPHARTIILLHGYPTDKGDILPSRLFLHDKYNLLFFDFRYLGESGGQVSSIGHNEVRDLRAALNYLHQRGLNEVAVWGLSMGAATALLALKDDPEIKAMIAETPYARLDWMSHRRYPIPGLSMLIGELMRLWCYLILRFDAAKTRPMDAAANSKIPVLLLYSRDDQLITYEHAEAMQEAVKNNRNVEIIIYHGKQHDEPADNYQELVGNFLAKYFPAKVSTLV